MRQKTQTSSSKETEELKAWAKEQPARDQSALLAEIEKATAKKQRPMIKAYSCHSFKPNEGCWCGVDMNTKTLKGRKIYFVKGRAYTLEGGVWGQEYSETVVDLKDLKG